MTINEAQEAVIDEFSRLHDWLDKYEHLIDLGNKLTPSDEGFKIDRNALQGCQSQVWISGSVADGKLSFLADSDSLIINGILSLLLRVLNDHTPAEIAAADLYFLKEIGLSTNLSPARANGLAAIVRHLRRLGETAMTVPS
jgi:cysteine desulfuration protein SufE